MLSRQLKPESFNDYESVRSRIPSQHHAVPDNFKVLNGVNGFTALIPAAKENGHWIKKEDTLSVAVV